MNRDETISILSYCKGVWKDHYQNMSKADHFQLIDDWQSRFETVPRRKVLTAVYCLSSNPTHPTVEEILAKAEDVTPGIDWKRLKESYTRHGFTWPKAYEEMYEQKLMEEK